jgi:hypothetical protein
MVRFTAVAAALLLACAPVSAATLSGIEGRVMVSRGGAYVPVAQTTELKPGDSVIADPSSGALLAYPDGCTVQVKPGEVVTVGQVSTCLTTQGTQQLTQQQGTVPQQNQGNLPVENPEGFGGFGPGTLALGAAGVAGVVGIVVAVSGDKKKSPASP